MAATAPIVAPERPWRRLRVFAATADEPRARRASDITRVVSTVLALAALTAAADPPPGFMRAVDGLLTSLPDFLDAVWQVALDASAVLAVVLVVVALGRRRLSVARDLVLAALVATVIAVVLGRIVSGAWPDGAALRSTGRPPWYPALRVALPGAVVIAASPHLVLPLRRLGRWAVGLTAVGVVALGATSALGTIAGILVATAAAAAVHVAFGSTAGRPSLALVAADLDELGVPTTSLAAAERQEAGLFLVRAVAADGAPIEVKVYGRDAHESAVLSTVWRTAWYRDAGAAVRIGRRQQVEHEAFVTLLARQAGVPTDAVVTAGATSGDDALLVLRPAGRPVATTGGLSGVAVDELWMLVTVLHGAGIAHGRVDEHCLVIDERSRLGIRDFRGSSAVATPNQRHVDRVQALVATVGASGSATAIAAARRHLGDDAVADVLPFLQPAVLTADQRRLVKDGRLDLAALRAEIADAIGAEVPSLQRLRRLSPASIARVALPAVAVIALLSLFAGIDAAELFDLVREASWWLLALGFLAAQLPRVSQSVSTAGAAPVPLPLGPLYALQLAVSYVNIAIPSAAGRIAVNIRFFQRHGMAPGTALAAGALDGVGGFVVQVGLLVGLLAFTPAALELDLGGAVDGIGPLVLAVAVLVAVAVGAVLVVAPLRRFIVGWVRRLAREAVEAIRGLRSPRRLAMLIGGNLATEVLFACALGVFVTALGESVGLGALLLTNIGVGLLSGLIPVPGGIGVAEGGLTIGLVQAGVSEEAAFAAVLAYRLGTFYLPPLWGYVAMRWLERNEHL